MFVKIVHQGGRVEIHDRPIVAAELLRRNPKCCVAHPDVFQQPYAVVSASTTLALGQKYYVVPLHTITRLQLNSQRQLHTQKKEQSSCTWFINKKDGCRGDGGSTRSPLAHLHHWQPGLESIKE